MAHPAHTPADQVARIALNATDEQAGPEGTGLRLAGDLALVAHGITTPDPQHIVLATDRDLDWTAVYRSMSDALREHGWQAEGRRDGAQVSWLLLTGPDRHRYSLTLVRQPRLRAPVVIKGTPVAALKDCLAAAKRALAAEASPDNLTRLGAIERKAASTVVTARPVLPHQAAAHQRAELRTDVLILARTLAAAGLLDLTTVGVRGDEQLNLMLLLAALRAATAAAQRGADPVSSMPTARPALPQSRRALARQVQQAHHRLGFAQGALPM